MKAAAWCASIALALAALPGAAGAEVWGYVDETGRAHIASHRVDERYRLFFRGSIVADPAAEDPADAAGRDALERTPLFGRIAGHPNAARFAALIDRHAAAHAVDPALVRAVIAVESAYEPGAVSPRGAVGLMQIIPDTGARYGLAPGHRGTIAEQLADPAVNVRIGVRYLSDLLAMFDQDVTLALAAYNAGEQSVRRYGNRVPPFAETRDYVVLVQRFHSAYRPRAAAAAPPTRPALPRRHVRLPRAEGAGASPARGAARS